LVAAANPVCVIQLENGFRLPAKMFHPVALLARVYTAEKAGLPLKTSRIF